MDHYRTIYNHHPGLYDRLVRREDHEKRLQDAVGRLVPCRDRRVAELGAGTGRLTDIFAASAGSVLAFDAALPMLAAARENLSRSGAVNCRLAVAENGALPLGDSSVDIAAAGWSIGHIPGWFPRDWRRRVEEVLGEMERVTSAGGSLLIVETLGTGAAEPAPPPGLLDYFELLESRGFVKHAIRTDYRFRSVREAEELLGFFFGDELAERAKRMGKAVFPECTGLWIRRR